MHTAIQKLQELFTRADRLKFLLLLLLLAMLAMLEMAGVASIMPFMLIATNPETIHANRWLTVVYDRFGFQSDSSFLLFAGYCVLGLLMINNTGKALNAWCNLRYQNGLVYGLCRRLLAMYMSRPYAFFLGRNTAKLGSTVLGEATRVISGIVGPIMDIASNTLVCFAIGTLLFLVNPVIALAIIGVLGGTYGTIYAIVRRKLSVLGEQQIEANFEKFKSASEALGGIKDLKILGRELSFLESFNFFARRHARNNVSVGVITQIPRYVLEIVAFGGILLVVLFLIKDGRQSTNVVPLLALYAFAGYRLMPALQALFAAVTNLRFNVSVLDLIHSDLVGDTDVPGDPEAHLRAISGAVPMPFGRTLELRRVSFQYAGTPGPSLRDLNLTIPVHTSIGLVGPTGCGKTTTVDVILGLLSPQAGQLLVDGVEISDSNRAEWQRNLGYVPQHIYLADDTIARNIAFGVPRDEIDMEAVHKAAIIANLNQFIETDLPEGYDTHIGERGVRLSGGQRQRIGIARALYRDPAILVLDEATSALDGITEEYVIDALRRLSGKKTVILIAHRLTTVRECNVIYQLDRGSVVASGSYDDLMRDSAWFQAAARGSP